MSDVYQTPQPLPEVLDVLEAASFLRVSEKTVRRNLSVLPHVRLGTKIRFSREALRGFVQCEKKKPSPKVSHPKADF